jgi:hypothetical protein
MEKTTEQVEKKEKDMNLNPTGRGGFGDHPENINPGGRPKNQESFAYWFNYFKNLSVSEFLKFPKEVPDDERSVACELAYKRVQNAREDLKEFQEVADRTEGKATQSIRHEGAIDMGLEEIANILQNVYKEDGKEENTNNQDFS